MRANCETIVCDTYLTLANKVTDQFKPENKDALRKSTRVGQHFRQLQNNC